MPLPLPTAMAFQVDLLGGALGTLAAVATTFAVVTLVASYYRFQHIVKQAEETDPEKMGAAPEEILRVQIARYLAGCARRGTSFSLSLMRVENPAVQVRIGAPIFAAVKRAARGQDIACVYDERTLALLTEAEPEDSERILARIAAATAAACAALDPEQLRVGIGSYPGHGLSGKELVQAAIDGLGQAVGESRVAMPEIIDRDREAEEAADAPAAREAAEGGKKPSGWKERRQSAMLDKLTGVLKPSAVSAYMQRLMSDLRRKKKAAALFCAGVNNLDHIARFHGQAAADAVLAGVSKILQDNLRADDLIGRHEKYAFLVLAQASMAEAEIIGKRISTLVQQAEFVAEGKRLKTTITLGVSTYPEHGRNLHHLFTAGQKVLDHSRQNDIRAYAVYDPQIHDKTPPKPLKSIKSVQA